MVANVNSGFVTRGSTMLWGFVLLCTVVIVPCLALDNGLARTPPMGWMSWERFRCNIDCVNDPANCISERLYLETTDRLAEDGYLDAGYEYNIIDDCWLAKKRDAQGRLQPDPDRFPHGIKYLADYVHSKGLKFGIYEDYGTFTCAGYPGIIGHMELDAQTFADWDVDYLKLDGCYAQPKTMSQGYPEMGSYLNKTGRSIIYSCSWPFYEIYSGMTPNYTAVAEHCNLWRNFNDIDDSWASVQSIIDYYGNNQEILVPHAGPGHWNDPDMLIIGNFGLSYEQSKVQMAMWAILAAPLIMSVDLRTIKKDYRDILLNRLIIEVNQDPMGIQGKRLYKEQGIEIWARPVLPTSQSYYSYAIAFLNRRTDGTPSEVAVSLKDLGLTFPGGYHIKDLYENQDYGVVSPDTIFKANVNPTGIVMVRADVATSERPNRSRSKGARGRGRFQNEGQAAFEPNPFFQNN